MIRPVLIEIGLFLVPFVLYAVILTVSRVGVLQAKAWMPRRLVGLVIAALVLTIASFLVLAQLSGAPPGSTYMPAHIEKAKLVQGAMQ